MGDPKKNRKKYQTPTTAWSKSRIEEEAVLVKEFGFKNKKEIWKVESLLRKFTRTARHLISAEGKQAEIETGHLLNKLVILGLIEPNSQLDKVLDINLNSLASRRLQSILCKRNLVRTVKQARQFVTHRHVMVGNKVITSPSYLVSKQEEELIKFVDNSTLAKPDHPERVDKSIKAELQKIVKTGVKSEKSFTKEIDKTTEKVEVSE